jgi:hypothetical protein
VARNEFIFAWLVLVTLILVAIMTVTGVVVWRSGLLSGEAPLVESSSEGSGSDSKGPPVPQEDPLLKATDSFTARVYCVDPSHSLLVAEERMMEGSPQRLGRIHNLLEALRSTPKNAQLRPAVPPELQFRTLFIDAETKTLYVDLANLPESWQSDDPIKVGLCLYSITQTVAGLGPDFQSVRFLVDGKEPDAHPGGFLLSEPFAPSEDWLGEQATSN